MRSGKSIVLFLSSLPVPKTNRYIRRKNGWVFKSHRVTLWETRALWELQNQYNQEPLKKPLSVEVYFFLPDRRKRDIDNMLKSLWDVLERAKVIENDELIWETKTVKVKDACISGTVIVIKPFRTPKKVLGEYGKLLSEFKSSVNP
ncbi:MAG TPA: RusA family crossover junction endodeoxyribonuclease [Aquifex aeolicus]|uniref:RusA family crossover junction endodeoxyribonuclease n=1 Tax=Aquifex aeolicus TaxID=63363 RepID=A0A9D0YQQ6_AQUAO|nr:RusA family crossover junction endodeoxyribonuclease [Aquificales bacterium]HIP98254.1 RusA family crossover junction endodeoxyribonuclease [Aquifex aeolicus]HIQ25978.1 RusA family crossover junction endodeoxyribonuclease [Aquifex aeolicus]